MIWSLLVALLPVLLGQPTETQFKGMEIQLDRFEQIGVEDLLNTTAMRVMKYNRTFYVFNGTASVYMDIDNSFEGTVKLARSLLGNQQFNEYPLKLPRTKLCQAMDEYYTKYQYLWLNSSNLPRIEKGKFDCPFPKGEYWLKNYSPDGSWIPPVVPEGYWRLTVLFWRNGEELGLTNLYMHVKKIVRKLL